MNNLIGLQCVSCGYQLSAPATAYLCPKCSGNFDAVYDYAAASKTLNRDTLERDDDPNIWRYWEILPFTSTREQATHLLPTLQLGRGPLQKAVNLGKTLDIPDLFLKDDTKSPSASFKDRASAVVAVYGRERGATTLTTASTGNAGCALACICANLQMPCVIFVPETAPQAKIAQLLIFGAKVVAVQGSYDDAFDLSLRATEDFGWYCRSTGFNPFTREGKKTAALELCEQMGWQVPDRVFVAIGDGNMISGMWKGFRDLFALGLIDKLPRMIGVQSKLSNALAQIWQKMPHDRPLTPEEIRTLHITPVAATTVADSISVDLPRDGVAAIRAVSESGGEIIEVSDQEILEAIITLARNEGLFGEPAGSTATAGMLKMARANRIGSKERIVCLVSGNGLKDPQAAVALAGTTLSCEKDCNKLRQFAQAHGLIK